MAMSSYYLSVLSHFFIGFYFAFFGLWNIYHWIPLLEVIAKKNLPHPYLLLLLGISWQIILGCMIIFDIYIKLAAFLLIPFTIVSVYLFYPFWAFKGNERKEKFTLFVTNITITLGALLMLLR